MGVLGCVPFVTGLLAVVLAVVGMRKTRNPAVRGRGLAIAGLVLGLVSLAGWGALAGGLGIGYVRSNPARPVFRQFVADLAAGNVAAAHASCTGNVTRPELATACAGIKPWGALQDVTVERFHFGVYGTGETAQFNGVATFANTRARFWCRMNKRAGAWKVDAFTFSEPPRAVPRGPAATAPAPPG